MDIFQLLFDEEFKTTQREARLMLDITIAEAQELINLNPVRMPL